MIFRHKQAAEELEEKRPSERPTPAPEPAESGLKLVEATQTTTRRLPVSLYLLDRLRIYPRLRDLVEGYLVVQDRIDRYELVMRSVGKVAGGGGGDMDFWTDIHGQLGGATLRADFPNELLADRTFDDQSHGDQTFGALVTKFDAAHRRARGAAMAGRNPHQSAQAGSEAHQAIAEILDLAQELRSACKGGARALLEELTEVVNRILPDEESASIEPPPPTRQTGTEPPGPPQPTDAEATRAIHGKHVERPAPAAEPPSDIWKGVG